MSNDEVDSRRGKETMTDTAPTHRWVAEKTGHSISAVARFRDASRPPTLDAMTRFEKVFGWAICDQLPHRDVGTWPHELERVLARAAKLEREGGPVDG